MQFSLCVPLYRYVPVYLDSRQLLQKRLPTQRWHGAALSDQHQWFVPMSILNTALTEKLKGKSLFADELAGHVFVLIFNLVVGIYGIKLVQQFAAWKMTSMPVSKGWSWLCVPIFGLTAAVFSVENIIDCIKHPDRGQVEDAVEKAMKEAEL